jgi:hypothetical protein
MNLHGIVRGAIGSVNPEIIAQLYRSNGYTKAPDFSQVPAYLPPEDVPVQVQSLTYTDLQKLDGLNIEGQRRAVYVSGRWSGVIRADEKGGDLLEFPDVPNGPMRRWLAVQALETWPDWVKLAVTEQTDLNVLNTGG